MATLLLQDTKFTFRLLSPDNKEEYWTKTEIAVENEYIKYKERGNYIARGEIEGFLSALSRLIAGGYEREYSIVFEKAGLAADLYAHTKNGQSVSRTERRENDCVMALRLLMRSRNDSFLGGVYTLLFHREEIRIFVDELQKEYDTLYAHLVHGSGKYLFAGVSPLGYKGCNYRYFDPTGKVKKGDYVWVRMGRHNTEQIVYVDSVRYYGEEDAPYDPKRVKQVLRKATKEELEKALT